MIRKGLGLWVVVEGWGERRARFERREDAMDERERERRESLSTDYECNESVGLEYFVDRVLGLMFITGLGIETA